MDKIVYDRLDDVISAIEYNGGGGGAYLSF